MEIFTRACYFIQDSVRQISSGLAYVHSLDILHRGIKPQDIVYHSVSPVYAIITDFGCSDPSPTSIRHNRGTVNYLAPEVMRLKDGDSNEPFSFPSDIRSLGVTLIDFLMSRHISRVLGRAPDYKTFEDAMVTTKADELHYPVHWKPIQELLVWDPENRPTAMELAQP
jgi:serine/threonine protein kinase